MKKYIFSISALLSLGTLSAQVRTVNSATNVSVTNSPAFIDASSNTTVNGSSNVGKGLIFPRVDLSAMTAFPSVTAGIPNSFPTRFDGMIVYNTAASGTAGVGTTQGTLSPGYWYYENKSATNTGGTWKPVSTATAAVANTASNGLTLSGNDVKLGGTLSQATTVTNNGNALNITGSGSTSTFASNGYVGVGTTAPTSMLQTNGSFATRYVALSTDTTLDGTYHTVNAVHNSGTVTLTLPSVTGVTGRQYVVQNNGTGTTNVVVSGGGTIEGQTTFTLNQVGQTAQLIAGNSEWQLVTNAIKSPSVPSGANIYTADGTINNNRIVSIIPGKTLRFTNGDVIVDNTFFTKNLSASQDLNVVGNTTVGGTITSNSTIFGGNLSSNGVINSAGDLTVGGNAKMNYNLNVVGTTTTKDINSSGSITSTGTITSNSTIFGGNLSSNGVINSAGDLTVGGNAKMNYNLNVVGTTTTKDINSSGSITATGNINTNSTIFGGNLSSNGVMNAAGNSYALAHINTSDKRLKSNIKNIDYGLTSILNLNPVQYEISVSRNIKDGKPVDLKTKHSIGFIAQDLNKVIPEATYIPKNENNEAWGVDYGLLVPVLTKAIQEQQAQIEQLKEQINELKKK